MSARANKHCSRQVGKRSRSSQPYDVADAPTIAEAAAIVGRTTATLRNRAAVDDRLGQLQSIAAVRDRTAGISHGGVEESQRSRGRLDRPGVGGVSVHLNRQAGGLVGVDGARVRLRRLAHGGIPTRDLG